MLTYLAHLIIALNQCVYYLDGQEVVINRSLRVGEENIGSNDCSQIVSVHLGPRLLIDLMERSNPVEEGAQDLQAITMSFRKKTTGKV